MEAAKPKPDRLQYAGGLQNLHHALIDYEKCAPQNKPPHKLLEWFIEVTKKNTAIFQSKLISEKVDQERYSKYKDHVYWVDFGCGIGSEIHSFHYAVVLKELECVAIVVPLTTKKETTPEWMKNNDLVVDIGEVTGFPDEDKVCFANISGLQSVSKKRLNRCGNKKEGYFDVVLSPAQLELIKSNIIENIIEK